jgi:GntR family transcriptional repressor for pyruvate dehydrogenase complex
LFREVRHNKVALDIIAQIREAILSGTLSPGDRLPAEKELVSKFGVSKHTLREAIRALEVMGFLEVRMGAGGGAVVLEADMKTTRDSIANFLYFQNVSIRDLSEVRKVFEPYMAQMAAEHLSTQELDDLAAVHQSCVQAVALGTITGRQEIDFHRKLAQASGNPVLILIQDFVNSLLSDSKSRLGPKQRFLDQVLAAHERILDALQARDPERAAQEMFSHVCEVESSLEKLRVEKDEMTKVRLEIIGGDTQDRVYALGPEENL